MKRSCLLIIAAGLFFGSCKSGRQLGVSKQDADTVFITQKLDFASYQASHTRDNDLLHTKLDLRFDWDTAHLLGKAWLTFKPYFHPTSHLILDAKGFEIHELAVMKGEEKRELKYKYDSLKLSIELDRAYSRDEEYVVYIDYTAKPNERTTGGSDAISSDKGLYFINNKGKIKDKPKQIWTQGETEANSAWFPTIDKPNERTTSDITFTFDTQYVCLSNGVMVESSTSGAMRTQRWVMKKPHAPYLFMMAIGDYHIETEYWRDSIELTYYVEHEFAASAKDIFKNTAEMLEFFSTKLGYDYPWPKLAQVTVRDYVSGAMENTTSIIYGEFAQRTKRELLDETAEGVIAHEIFHHWFGDLVTCESWANIPLNESFATYGEYIWAEYKYGRDFADHILRQELRGYLWEAKRKQRPLIQYYYEDKEDVFDGHSYNKGGRVLHMLRKYVGDDAFFTALGTYLSDNEYTAVEVHDLRLAFEKVTGEDLNWFFQQWFHNSGHPKLTIDYTFNYGTDSIPNRIKIHVNQTPSSEDAPVYRLPMRIDIYNHGNVSMHEVMIEKDDEWFSYPIDDMPDLVNVDAEKVLLCEKEDKKPDEWYKFQYFNAPLYMDRWEAMQFAIGKSKEGDTKYDILIGAALKDKFWGIRRSVLALLDSNMVIKNAETIAKLAKDDPKSRVRATALDVLGKQKMETHKTVFIESLKDSSYAVISKALEGLTKLDPEASISAAKGLEGVDNKDLLSTIADIYADTGNSENRDYFERIINKESGRYKFIYAAYYSHFLSRMDDKIADQGMITLSELDYDKLPSWLNGYYTRSMRPLEKSYESRKVRMQEEMEKHKEGSKQYMNLSKELEMLDEKIQLMAEILKKTDS